MLALANSLITLSLVTVWIDNRVNPLINGIDVGFVYDFYSRVLS